MAGDFDLHFGVHSTWLVDFDGTAPLHLLTPDLYPPGCGVAASVLCAIVKDFVKFQSFKPVIIVWLVLAPVTDIVISVALVW